MTPKLSRWAAVCVLALCPTALATAADRPARSSEESAVRPVTTTRRPATKAAPRATTTSSRRTSEQATDGQATRETATATARRTTTVSKAKKAPPEAQLTSATSRRTRTMHRQPTPPPDELMPPDTMPEESMPADGQQLAPPEVPSTRKLKPIPQGDSEIYEGEMIYEDGSYCGDECCDIPCAAPGCGGFIAGFDFVFLQANFSDNPGFYRTQTNSRLYNETDEQLKYDPKLSSRVWFGFQHASGLGARARYFYFDQNSQNVSGTATFDTSLSAPFTPGQQGFRQPTTTAAGDQFTAGSGLNVQAVDLEGTKKVSFGNWSLLASGGFRYGVIKQNYNSAIRDGQGLLDSTSQYGHRFEGFGPQFALEARRQVTSRISLFSAARIAILFGHGSGQLTVTEGLQNSVQDYTLTKSRRSDLLPIAELQVGGDYTTNFFVGTARLVCRGALEAQVYQGAGNATSENGDLALVGGSFSIGLNY